LQKRIWITWEQQRRNRTLSKALNAELFEFDLKYGRLIRYPIALWKTLAVFISEKAEVIFVQNPSIILSLFSVIFGIVFRKPVIVDAHNAGVYPNGGRNIWAKRMADFLFRKAALTMVSNEVLAEYVIERGGNVIAVPDPIPEFDVPPMAKLSRGTYDILFICSWADDEPYGEVIEAAGMLDPNIKVYITGKSKGREKKFKIPGNVILTGYLPEERYLQMLYSSDAVIDLTTRKDCLVCGAYESVAAEKPLILSDSKVLRKYFSRGALYTDNTSADLASQINMAILKRDRLQAEIRGLKLEKKREWSDLLKQLEARLIKLNTFQ
jgi:hypothetical protein